MSKYIVDILDKDKYALEIGITKNGSPASQRVLDAVKVGIPYVERPRGEWIEKSKFDRLCKNCGQQHIGDKRFANFCPNCGRDNRPRENNSSSMIINGKYSENVEYGTRVEIRKKGGE